MGKEAGKPCYIMIGNNMTYEPSFIDLKTQKQAANISIDLSCGVEPRAALGKSSMKDIRRPTSKMLFDSRDNGFASSSFLNHNSF